MFSATRGYTHRSYLAVLHWNNMIIDDERKVKERHVYSKVTGQMTSKKFKERPKIDWKKNILMEAIQLRSHGPDEEQIMEEENDEIEEENDMFLENQVLDEFFNIESNESDEEGSLNEDEE